MRLENFKSYAGIVEIGPFQESFSAVVGPNGSGKSNVIDALLFVFGKRASKLRLKKISELIHHSASLTHLETASVTVFFREIFEPEPSLTEKSVFVSQSEFTVTRTASRHNASKYFLNGEPSSFTQVTAMLRAKGVDLDHNRFLILQGEVEQIAMMKSKGKGGANAGEEGLLEYLEDIIGSNAYVEPIERAYEDLDGLNETRVQRLNRMRLVEKEKEQLEKPRAEVLAYLRKERALYGKENVLYQIFIEEARQSHKILDEQRQCLKNTYQTQLSSMDASKTALTEAENALTSAREAYDAGMRQLEAVKESFAALEKEDVVIREKLKGGKEKIESLAQSESEAREKIKVLVSKREVKEKEIPILEEEAKGLEVRLKAENDRLKELMQEHTEETAALRHRLKLVQLEMEPFQTSANELRSIIETTEMEMQLALEPLDRARKAVTSNERALDGVKEAIGQNEKDHNAIMSRHSELERFIRKGIEELEQVKAEETESHTRFLDTRSVAEEAASSASSHKSRSRLLESLLKASEAGGSLEHAKLYGRLGDLGAIDGKYDVAISTACSALDNLVVETTTGAQMCVEYLRTNRLGRATFIILEQLHYLENRSRQSFSLPKSDSGSNIARLYDMIQVRDDRFRIAFYFALRDTLATDNLDQASAIAFQGRQCRYRVVTLDGQLVEMSGAMSGGGQRVRRGGMSSSLPSETLNAEQVTALEKTANDARDRLHSLRNRRMAMETQLEEWTIERDSIKREIPKLTLNANALDRQWNDLLRQQMTLKAECKVVEETEERVQLHVQKSKAIVNEKRKELNSVQTQLQELEQKVMALKEEMAAVGGDQARKVQESIAKLTERMEDAVSKATKHRVEIKTGVKLMEKLELSIANSQTERDNFERELESLRQSCNSLEERGLNAMQQQKTMETETEEKKANVERIQQSLAKLRKKMGKFATVELEYQNELEVCVQKIEEQDTKASYWKSKLASVQATYILEQEQYAGVFDGEDDEIGNAQLAGAMSKSICKKEVDRNADVEMDSSHASVLQLPILSSHQLSSYQQEELQFEIAVLTQERDALRENVNMHSLTEYQAKEKQCKARFEELEMATKARDAKRQELETLQKKRLDEFMSAFVTITLKLKEMYQMITLGGDAELELVDSLDPFSEGVVFSVRPYKKSWKPISNLSGGEKTLASLALVFALHHFKPTPLYVMDEIDAALDYRNVSIVANYIKERTRDAQFIVISLRNNMFELADRLIGIYKTDDTTKTVTIDPKAFEHIKPQLVSRHNVKTPDEEEEEREPTLKKTKVDAIQSVSSVVES